jgi:hypothetical protein
MKNILVLSGGADNDEAVFLTALAAAQPLRTDLDSSEAAWESHSGFVWVRNREMMAI